MLMDEVGSQVSMMEKGGLSKALRALAELHQTGYWHGSARRDNLLACGDRLKWCDVQRADSDASTAYRRHRKFEADLESLLRSFGRAPSPDHRPRLPPTPDHGGWSPRGLDAYVARPTVAGLLTHADRIGFKLALEEGGSEAGGASAEPDANPPWEPLR